MPTRKGEHDVRVSHYRGQPAVRYDVPSWPRMLRASEIGLDGRRLVAAVLVDGKGTLHGVPFLRRRRDALK